MAKLSRIAKYEDLRNKLQNDSEADIRSNELNEYASKLNRFDSSAVKDINFTNQPQDPIQNRRDEYLNTSSIKIPTSNHTSSFDNEYLDEYINEVKQYNKEQGLLVSEDTQKNILNEIYGERPAMNKPFKTVENPTSEIPFSASVSSSNPYSGLSDDDLEKTRSNIAAEVKSLISGNTSEFDLDKDVDMDLAKQLEIQQTENRKLVKDTEKLQLQLDEYGDNLTEFDDKVENANRILNFVLVLMIFAVLIVIGLLVYWHLLNQGII